MRSVDRLLQAWRARKARPWISAGAKVLDVGCHQGEFLSSLGDRIGPSVGLDPLATCITTERYQLIPDILHVPSSFAEASFDAIVMLATLEHIRDKDSLAAECFRLLRPGGRVIITVPSHLVDALVHVLCMLRLADGMSLEEHHGYDPRQTPEIFARHGFVLEYRRRFQLGLNHLYVLRKESLPPSANTNHSAADECIQV
jgi:2-polyprenyl-3-methyl-5-hydroxy-6-metoxy-1,4-benzoquinol methylase